MRKYMKNYQEWYDHIAGDVYKRQSVQCLSRKEKYNRGNCQGCSDNSHCFPFFEVDDKADNPQDKCDDGDEQRQIVNKRDPGS